MPFPRLVRQVKASLDAGDDTRSITGFAAPIPPSSMGRIAAGQPCTYNDPAIAHGTGLERRSALACAREITRLHIQKLGQSHIQRMVAIRERWLEALRALIGKDPRYPGIERAHVRRKCAIKFCKLGGYSNE